MPFTVLEAYKTDFCPTTDLLEKQLQDFQIEFGRRYVFHLTLKGILIDL